MGRLSNDDGGGIENGKKKKKSAIGKSTTLHEQHTFLYISLSLLHDYNLKLCSFTFYGERERKTTILLFFFWT